ncbi:apoptosis-associated speck-like protein containing a CARD [Lates japonicus]|uniref:Apoptosis-associated speck-like protein containing a CARD n=1 Tax=Lates japonicus TaxID=270547 RepID=A0AAD3R2I6_LATJO|nr:apoptosis-associated speck-like protein containing a CARD [Lates japonicus]
MAPKTIKNALKDTLEDLSQQNFKKFCSHLLDRREEPRVKRNRVEGKDFLDVTDVLVSTFTETGALRVAVELLKQIECTEEATRLVKETEQSPKPNSSDTVKPSSGAAGGNTMAGAGGTEKHFVDKHKPELIQKVGNVAPILDELLDNNVIQQELYDKIRAMPTTQEKMRELYSTCLKASKKCKDIFYASLQKNELYLIEDLQGKE